MKGRQWTELFVLVVYLAVVFTLVRPGSQGPKLVAAIGGVLAQLISAAVGGGSWAAPSGQRVESAPEGGNVSAGSVFA